MLEPGGHSFAVVTRLTGTTQGSPTQSEGNATHEAAAEQGQGEVHTAGCTGTTRHESWAGLVLLWAGLVSNIGAHSTVAKRRCMCCRHMLPSDWLDCIAIWRRREN